MAVFAAVYLVLIALLGLALGCALHLRRRERTSAADRADLAKQNSELVDQVRTLQAAAQDRGRAEPLVAPRSRLLAAVSHEIRTPLSGVLGLADLLAGTRLTREQQSYVAAVKTSGEALMMLVDDILDFSRIDAGHLELAHEVFDPVALVEGVVELLAPRAHGKGLEIASFVSADVPTSLTGDPHRLRQVLLNLAGNAVKFTETGGVGVAVGRCVDGRILFSVSDTGPGVDADKRALIFEEFAQAGDQTSGRQDGAGLGLAIVKRIVSEMGGEIGVDNRAAGGALFAFRIALEPAGTSASENRPIVAGHRALIVSAEVFQSAYLAGALEDCGCNVLRVATSVKAVALLQTSVRAFDTVFVDCAAGVDDARAVAAVARLAGAKKIVMLFSPFERHRLGVFSTGFDEWLVKPIRRRSVAERFGATPASAVEPAGPLPTGRAKVLLAEDNPINALIARAALDHLGAEVVHVADGESAVRAIETALTTGGRPFDLALVDLNMPLLDGLETARRIRAIERGRGRAPVRIVATTAHAFLETRNDCEGAGMDEVMTKPIEPAQLRRVVAAAAPQEAVAS